MKSPTRHFFSINDPCSEDWNEMIPDERGKFCLHCNKSVIYFTLLSDEEIIKLISCKNDVKICGQFRSDQLSRWIEESEVSKNNPALYKIALSLFMLTSSATGTAQENKNLAVKIDSAVHRFVKDSMVSFSGVIKDIHGKPLANVMITNKQNGKTSWANQDGMFEITGSIGDTILFIKKESCQDDIVALRDIIQSPINSRFANHAPTASPVRIRGEVSSISSNDKPIYVIDGKIYPEKKLKKLNPDNIKSIQILKGPEAKPLFGSATTSGAIIIETKHNQKSKIKKLRWKR